MSFRRLVGCALFLAVALGGVGCSSAGPPATPVANGRAAAQTVTVKAADGRVVCVITLEGGKGSCKASTQNYAPGTVKFQASFSGGAGLKPSRSSVVSVRLSKATTKTTLSLSAAKVKSGTEQAERLGVRTIPQIAGTPVGSIIVRAGGTVVCAITLRSGMGSCTLTAKELAPGSYRLSASYPGSTDFTGSVSAEQTLAVTR